MSSQGGILLFSENQNVARELAGKARQVADRRNLPVAVVGLGQSAPDGADFAPWGVETVYTVQSPQLNGFNPETYTTALAGVVEQVQPEVLLVGATKPGLELSARLAERLPGRRAHGRANAGPALHLPAPDPGVQGRGARALGAHTPDSTASRGPGRAGASGRPAGSSPAPRGRSRSPSRAGGPSRR